MADSFTGCSSSLAEALLADATVKIESSIPEAHPADQDWVFGVRQHDHVTDIDVADRYHVIHESDDIDQQDQLHARS